MRILNTFSCKEEKFLDLCFFFSTYEGTAILYTGKATENDASFLFLFPTEVITLQSNQTLFSSSKQKQIKMCTDPFTHLEEQIGLFCSSGQKNCNYPNQEDFIKWVGYLSYEMGGYSDRDKQFTQQKSILPLCYFQKSAIVIKFCHKDQSCTLFIDPKAEKYLTDEENKWFRIFQSKKDFSDLIKKSIKASKNSIKASLIKIENKEEYLKKIETIQEEIREGNVYQANLSHEIYFKTEAKPHEIFFSMIENHPTPFAAYLNLKEYQIISLSPERFLKKEGRRLLTIPIKGTIERGKNETEDLKNYKKLQASEKDKAELVMITDLLRNDLSKVSKVGSVIVKKLFEIEGFSNVWHLHSVIESECLENQTPISIVRALFPGGSITGCPKLASLETIQNLEKRPRGIYTGSIGYFTNRGDFDFNIAIRTLLYHQKHQSLGIGGAIVIDSDTEKEYAETLHKGAAFFHSLGIPWDDIF